MRRLWTWLSLQTGLARKLCWMLLNHVEGGEEGGGLLRPEYRSVIAIGLDDFAKISAGSGDEVIVGLSDGTTMTGAELVNAAIAGALGGNIYAGLFHPTAGPVNLYEARFASFKQRIMATAENLVSVAGLWCAGG